MRNMKALLLIISTVAIATVSAFADPRNPKPDWIDGSSMEYPNAQYIAGVGAADDRASAEDRARAEISKVFQANVTVNENLNASESNNQFSQTISQEVKTVSTKALEGVQLVEHWQDGATRVYYALAVLDRAKAKAALTEKLAGLDKQAQQWKDQLDNSGEKLARAKAGMKLLTVLKARGGLNAEMRVIDAGGHGVDSPIDEAKVRPEAAKAVSALDVAVRLSGDNADEVETAVVKGLAALGLQSRTGASKDADIEVSGKIDTAEMKGDGSAWRWARSTTTVSLKDAHTGKVVTQFDASDREASADFAEAARRSRVELAKRVADQASAAVTDYFENN